MQLSQDLDPTRLRKVFSAFPTGVVALAAKLAGQPYGFAASSFTSVSLQPPLICVSVARSSGTWPVLRRASRFGVSVFSRDQRRECRQLGSRGKDKFAGLSWQASESGAMFLDGACAWLECSFYDEIEAGDHEIVVMRVLALDAVPDVEPLVFHASSFYGIENLPSVSPAPLPPFHRGIEPSEAG